MVHWAGYDNEYCIEFLVRPVTMISETDVVHSVIL